MAQLTWATQPGAVDLPDSNLATDQPLTDYSLTKISNNAKFAAVRPETFYGCGKVRQTPDGPAAVDAARRLRTLQPGHEGFLTVADALMLNGEVEAAAREYRMAVGLAPKSARAHAGLAGALAALDQADPAADQYLQTIQLDPTNAEHYQKLSALYERTGRLDLAIVALRDGATAATTAPRAIQAEIADRLAALYDRAEMRQEASQERARAQALRAP